MHATTSKSVATVVFTLQSKVFTRPKNTSLETEMRTQIQVVSLPVPGSSQWTGPVLPSAQGKTVASRVPQKARQAQTRPEVRTQSEGPYSPPKGATCSDLSILQKYSKGEGLGHKDGETHAHHSNLEISNQHCHRLSKWRQTKLFKE